MKYKLVLRYNGDTYTSTVSDGSVTMEKAVEHLHNSINKLEDLRMELEGGIALFPKKVIETSVLCIVPAEDCE